MSRPEFFLVDPASYNPLAADGATLTRLATRFTRRGYSGPSPSHRTDFAYCVNPTTLHALELDLAADALARHRPMVGIMIDDRRGWMVRGVPVVVK